MQTLFLFLLLFSTFNFIDVHTCVNTYYLALHDNTTYHNHNSLHAYY